MRKDPHAPGPSFVDGPPLEPEEQLRGWIASREGAYPRGLFRLPFTFAPGETARAALGVPRTGEAGWVHRLDDTPLGIALAERLRTLRSAGAGSAGEGPCTVWLSVRFGPTVAAFPVGEDLPVAAVHAVHERVEEPALRGELRAQAARGDACLAVRLLHAGHCARGPLRCPRCRDAEARPPAAALLDLCPDDPQAARPTVAASRAGQRVWLAYEVLRWFDSPEQARAFAAERGLSDVELEAEHP